MKTATRRPKETTRIEAAKTWRLRLYVADQTPKSLTAFANLQRICAQYLDERYEIEVIDLLKRPQLAEGDQIVAIPTLVRRLPVPMRKIIGDLSNIKRVLIALDLQPHDAGGHHGD